MAENKKSFILYCDYQQVFNTLTDKEAGQLIKHILSYVNDENPPELENRLLKIAFDPIKAQLKRDLSEWEQEKKFRSESGKKGGLKSGEARRSKRSTPSKNEAPLQNDEANGSKTKQRQANEADNVTVTVTVTDTVTVNGGVIMPAISEKQKQVREFFLGVHGTIEQADKFYRHYEGTRGFENIHDFTPLAQNWFFEDEARAKKAAKQNQPTW